MEVFNQPFPLSPGFEPGLSGERLPGGSLVMDHLLLRPAQLTLKPADEPTDQHIRLYTGDYPDRKRPAFRAGHAAGSPAPTPPVLKQLRSPIHFAYPDPGSLGSWSPFEQRANRVRQRGQQYHPANYLDRGLGGGIPGAIDPDPLPDPLECPDPKLCRPAELCLQRLPVFPAG